MASDHASLPSPAPAAPTHACVRCGKPTAIDRGLCEECNPLGLRDSASSQVHGTVFVGVLVAVIALAFLGRLAVSGVGPFEAVVGDVTTAGDGLAVTFEVTNTGTAAGQTTCRISDVSRRSNGATALVTSPRIEPGETRSFTRELAEFGSEPRDLAIECSAP